MAILIDETKRVLVQGITGREGQARTRLMREYGTNVIAGVTPGKAQADHPRRARVQYSGDAVKALGRIDISVLFVPAAGVKEAAISALDAGIKLTVLVPRSRAGLGRDGDRRGSEANDATFLDPTRPAS